MHEFDPEVDHHGPEAATIYAASLIRQWLKQASKDDITQIPSPDGVVGFTAKPSDGRTQALIFVSRELTLAERKDLIEEATSNGWRATWLLWNRRPLLDRGNSSRDGLARALPGREALRIGKHGAVVWMSPATRTVAIPRRPLTEAGGIPVTVLPLLNCALTDAGITTPGALQRRQSSTRSKALTNKAHRQTQATISKAVRRPVVVMARDPNIEARLARHAGEVTVRRVKPSVFDMRGGISRVNSAAAARACTLLASTRILIVLDEVSEHQLGEARRWLPKEAKVIRVAASHVEALGRRLSADARLFTPDTSSRD